MQSFSHLDLVPLLLLLVLPPPLLVQGAGCPLLAGGPRLLPNDVVVVGPEGGHLAGGRQRGGGAMGTTIWSLDICIKVQNSSLPVDSLRLAPELASQLVLQLGEGLVLPQLLGPGPGLALRAHLAALLRLPLQTPGAGDTLLPLEILHCNTNHHCSSMTQN